MIAVMLKEWRRLTRLGGAPWALLAFVLAPVLISAFALKPLASGEGIMPQMAPLVGAYALNLVGAWQTLFLAIFAPWLAATAMSAEWENDAIRLYVAAGGRPIQLIFGKLLAIVGYLVLLILAGLPAFAIPWLAGGVTPMLMLRVIGMEAATALIFTGLGFLLGAFGRRAGNLAVAGLTLGLLLTLGTGLASTMGGAPASGDQAIIMMKMGWGGGMPPQAMGPDGMKLPVWLWTNPLVGLNGAVSQQFRSALFGLPGSESAPIYKEYKLWQAQLAVAAPLALLLTLFSWLTLATRFAWKGFRWPFKRRKREVTSHVAAG